MGALIDASVLVEIERGGLDLQAVLEAQADLEVAISAVTASELLHGVHRATQGKRRMRREAFVEHLLGRLPVVPFDLLAARVHARLWAELAAKGTPVGERDLLIAATAVARGYAVATHDTRSFPRIPGVTLLAW